MEKSQLQNIIPFYIGCRCLNSWFPPSHEMYNKGWILKGIDKTNPIRPYILQSGDLITQTDSVTLILKRLSDITKEDHKRHSDIMIQQPIADVNDCIKIDALQTIYLCNQGYWLFNESSFINGEVIDAKLFEQSPSIIPSNN